MGSECSSLCCTAPCLRRRAEKDSTAKALEHDSPSIEDWKCMISPVICGYRVTPWHLFLLTPPPPQPPPPHPPLPLLHTPYTAPHPPSPSVFWLPRSVCVWALSAAPLCCALSNFQGGRECAVVRAPQNSVTAPELPFPLLTC